MYSIILHSKVPINNVKPLIEQMGNQGLEVLDINLTRVHINGYSDYTYLAKFQVGNNGILTQLVRCFPKVNFSQLMVNPLSDITLIIDNYKVNVLSGIKDISEYNSTKLDIIEYIPIYNNKINISNHLDEPVNLIRNILNIYDS